MNKADASYFPETNSLFIDIADRPAARTIEVAYDILVGFDEGGEVVSIEIPGGARELFADLIEQEVQARLAQRKAG